MTIRHKNSLRISLINNSQEIPEYFGDETRYAVILVDPDTLYYDSIPCGTDLIVLDIPDQDECVESVIKIRKNPYPNCHLPIVCMTDILNRELRGEFAARAYNAGADSVQQTNHPAKLLYASLYAANEFNKRIKNSSANNIVEIGALVYNRQRSFISLGSLKIPLSPSEKRIFECLNARRGDFVLPGRLAEIASIHERSVKILISRLRGKLDILGFSRDFISPNGYMSGYTMQKNNPELKEGRLTPPPGIKMDRLLLLEMRQHRIKRIIKIGDLTCDEQRETLSLNDIEIRLTRSQQLVFSFLYENRGSVISREKLAEICLIKQNSIFSLMYSLRKKLGTLEGFEKLITTSKFPSGYIMQNKDLGLKKKSPKPSPQ